MEWLLILFAVFLHNECEPVVDLSIACNGVCHFLYFLLSFTNGTLVSCTNEKTLFLLVQY